MTTIKQDEMSAKSETAKREELIMQYWREDGTFARSVAKDAPNGEFVFYDGPPFATGLPHMGSLLSSIIKDVVPRYKTMRGYRVERRWGWDCHGLPIESLIEKRLGLSTKKDIEKIGIDKFNETARGSVLEFEHEWERYIERVGRWVDFRNSYKTMDNSYMESVWWALKRLYEKGLLYEGRKVLMYCNHCETPLAKAEIAMDNTYKDITEESLTIKFKITNSVKLDLPKDTYMLAWTTTPWTLPGNVALAVGEEIEYGLYEQDGSNFIRACSTTEMIPLRKFAGSELLGVEYEQLFNIPLLKNETSQRVYTAKFVTTNDGTGIVHIAPMYGEDDFVLGIKENLPITQLLTPNGMYGEFAPEFIRGKYIKGSEGGERDIKRNLNERGLIFDRKNHTHSYPHCYRCGTPLIYNAVSSWFVGINSVPNNGIKTLKERLLEENKSVNWVPEHLRDGRFNNIVESAPDWTISRNRFWASPLPVWKAQNGKIIIIGSLDELRASVKKSGNKYFVMRHGEAECNISGALNSTIDKDIHLTPKGRADVQIVVAEMQKPDIIFTSQFLRARETAEIVRRNFGLSNENIIQDARLNEQMFGDFDGKKWTEYKNSFAKPEDRHTQSIGGSEPSIALRRRVGDFLANIESQYKDKVILIVTHGQSSKHMLNIAHCDDAKEVYQKNNKKTHLDTAGILELPYVPMPRNHDYDIDLHRPYVDSIILTDENGVEYSRIPEVVDCWVESGSMPFAQNADKRGNVSMDEYVKTIPYPGDFIAEYIAQTRTWFYYMHALGVALFDKRSFSTVVSTGTILASDGAKMSKSKGNYTDPLILLDKYGADAMRLTLMQSPVMQSEDLRFRDDDVKEAHNRVVGILWNCFKFYDLYKEKRDCKFSANDSKHPLDIWIIARLDEVIQSVTTAMDAYDTPLACRIIKEFVDDYSTWYVRRSRERVKSGLIDAQYALATQADSLVRLACLIAPIMPFIAEGIYRGVEGGGSVHLQNWPTDGNGKRGSTFFATVRNKVLGDPKSSSILRDMALVRATVSRALEARDKAGIKVRQPLSMLEVSDTEFSQIDKCLLDIISDEVNVKSVRVVSGISTGEVRLNTEISDELRQEGQVREVIRAVQQARKEHGMTSGQVASASVSSSDPDLIELVRKNSAKISEVANLSSIALSVGESALNVAINK